MSHTIRSGVAIRNEVLLIPALFTCGALFLFSTSDAAAQATFSTTVPLNSNAATDSGEEFFARMATDGAGNWVVAWESDDSLGGTIGIDCDILVAASADNGLTWTTPIALNSNAATDSGDEFDVHVATDGAGTWMATWESTDDLGGTIGIDVDILVATSVNNGLTWTTPIPLNSNAATDSGDDFVPTTISVGSGVWVVVWHSYDDLGGTIGVDGDILFARSTDDGANWTAPQALNDNAATDTGEDDFTDVVTDGGANWVAVWDSSENLGGAGSDYDIFVATSADFGVTWTTPRVLNTNAATDTGDDFLPTLGRDIAGNWVVVWTSDDSLGGTIGTDSDVLVAVSADNGANWSSPQALNTNAATDSGDELCPRVAVDSLGNWVAVWESNDDLGGTIGLDCDIISAHSTDSGVTWTTPQPLNTTTATDTGDDFFPVIASTGERAFLVTWFSDDTLGGTVGFDNDIFTATGAIVVAGNSSGGGCFIATAAYGTPLDGRIDVLRAFRDKYLLRTSLGAAFVDTYYRISPPVAKRVAKSPALAGVLRILLTPTILAAQAFLAHRLWFVIMAACIIVFASRRWTLSHITRRLQRGYQPWLAPLHVNRLASRHNGPK